MSTTKEKTITVKTVKKPKELRFVGLGSYRGTTMIQFHTSDKLDDRFPFQFGPGKARKLLSAMDANGVDAVIEKLRELAAMQTSRAD